MSDDLCFWPGPRGLTCGRLRGHSELHQAVTDDEGNNGPPEACEVCAALAGLNCADPKACELTRRLTSAAMDADPVAEA